MSSRYELIVETTEYEKPIKLRDTNLNGRPFNLAILLYILTTSVAMRPSRLFIHHISMRMV